VRTLAEKLAHVQNRRAELDIEREATGVKAAEDARRFGLVIRERALQARPLLSPSDRVKWEIQEGGDIDERKPVCTVTVYARLTKPPLKLKIMGLRPVGTDHADSSSAVSGVAVTNRTGDSEFTEWEELDDGRWGRFEIHARMCATGRYLQRSDQQGAPTLLPFEAAEIQVRAIATRYDWREQKWDDEVAAKIFSDPDEAWDAFEDLLAVNIAYDPADPRSASGHRVVDGHMVFTGPVGAPNPQGQRLRPR